MPSMHKILGHGRNNAEKKEWKKALQAGGCSWVVLPPVLAADILDDYSPFRNLDSPASQHAEIKFVTLYHN